MSWTGSTTTRHADAENEINGLAVSPDSDAAEQTAQVQAAKDAAIAIIKSGAIVSDDSQDVSISIAGHASPPDQPAGSALNSVTVTVYQVARVATDA